MIINELAYRVTVKTDEFLNGKRKIQEEVSKLNKELSRSEKEREKELKKQREELEKFGKSATSAFRNVTTAAAGFLGIGAGLYGIKQLFTSTADEIVRASTQAKFFGTDVNKVFGVRRGFQQAGLNADAFIGASGNARMALANIADPTIFGGLTGAAQNLMVLGARTGLNINNLGDPNKALSEFTRYGKGHSQENLMQVMAAAGFDPSDAAKIKSGELKQLVDSETKKSNITAQQVKEQENLLVKIGELGSQMERVAQGIAIAFSPEVIAGMEAFGKWIEAHQGDIIGFFNNAGDKVKAFTEAVGGAENALWILAGAYGVGKVGSKVAGAAIGSAIGGAGAGAGAASAGVGALFRLTPWLSIVYSGDAGAASTMDELNRTGATWQNQLIDGDVEQHAQTARRNKHSAQEMDGLLDGITITESGGNPLAYNAKSGAAGAYQFRPGTARDVGLRVDSQVDERLDPEKARAAAAIYMSQLLKRYNGNVDNALRAYNWGMGNVDKWIANGSDESQLPKETRDYTGKVYGNMGNARNYYAMQGRLADRSPYQLSSSGGNPQITNSTHINTVNVNSNPQSVDALTKSVEKQAQRSTTNASFSSAVRG